MSVPVGLLLGLLGLVGGFFQFMWGDTLLRDHLAWSKRWPLFFRLLGGRVRLWPRRFDRAYAVVTGSLAIMAGVAFLTATAVEVLD